MLHAVSDSQWPTGELNVIHKTGNAYNVHTTGLNHGQHAQKW